MKYCTFFAAMLALSNWAFVTTSQTWAHGGTDLSIAKCDCEDEEGDGAAAVLECHEEDDAD